MKYMNLQTLWPAAAMLLLFCAAIIFRPLLPIDETRYMGVAWEMWLRQDWLAPLTVNFQPYHHKPPMLFWMINASWSILGVSRGAGLLPIALAATACVYLTKILAQRLFKPEAGRFENLPFLMIGSVPFLIYNTLVMFDVTLMMFILLALLALVSYAENKKPVFILAMALALGLGVLVKGPVAWLYVIFPVLLGPYWMQKKQGLRSWYGGCALAFVLSVIPAILWLIPVLKATNPDFAFWLVWEQTAGRISGKMENAHSRPLYFYLPLIPVLFLPWALFPSFWAAMPRLKAQLKTSMGLRFILCWCVPVVIAFSFIGGKQPHYLIPLLPGVLIVIAYGMKMDMCRVKNLSIAMVIMLILGQAIAAQSIFKKYDLEPIAHYVHDHEDKDWAFVRKYQGELSFLGRLHKPLEDQTGEEIRDWFQIHPQGMAVIRYDKPEEIEDLEMVTSIPYRSKSIGVFKSRD
ncbi:MAG: glycosyltransferase family 39 protein [Alphaproteobacteria bacterium]|nr:glycosyltransferase family 39 protein [Alphaproteobacteria bacterium]